MRWSMLALPLVAGHMAAADILVPVRMIRAREVIAAEDVMVGAGDAVGSLSDPAELIGQEARVVLYPGRPVQPGDVGPPAIVGRNDLITLVFRRGALSIMAEGRALGRGAEGDRIRAMNLASKATVTGRIQADGTVEVE